MNGYTHSTPSSLHHGGLAHSSWAWTSIRTPTLACSLTWERHYLHTPPAFSYSARSFCWGCLSAVERGWLRRISCGRALSSALSSCSCCRDARTHCPSPSICSKDPTLQSQRANSLRLCLCRPSIRCSVCRRCIFVPSLMPYFRCKIGRYGCFWVWGWGRVRDSSISPSDSWLRPRWWWRVWRADAPWRRVWRPRCRGLTIAWWRWGKSCCFPGRGSSGTRTTPADSFAFNTKLYTLSQLINLIGSHKINHSREGSIHLLLLFLNSINVRLHCKFLEITVITFFLVKKGCQYTCSKMRCF